MRTNLEVTGSRGERLPQDVCSSGLTSYSCFGELSSFFPFQFPCLFLLLLPLCPSTPQPFSRFNTPGSSPSTLLLLSPPTPHVLTPQPLSPLTSQVPVPQALSALAQESLRKNILQPRRFLQSRTLNNLDMVAWYMVSNVNQPFYFFQVLLSPFSSCGIYVTPFAVDL